MGVCGAFRVKSMSKQSVSRSPPPPLKSLLGMCAFVRASLCLRAGENFVKALGMPYAVDAQAHAPNRVGIILYVLLRFDVRRKLSPRSAVAS